MKTCKKCGSRFPTRIEIDGKVRNLNSRKFCLGCSPFNEHNTKDKTKTAYNCKLCGKISTTRRKVCPSCGTKVRRYRQKSAAIAYKGGKCSNCGWKGAIAGFQFHHEGKKDFELGSAANKSWEVVKAEVDKCILLCANCHMIHHSSADDKFIDYALNNYKGRQLSW